MKLSIMCFYLFVVFGLFQIVCAQEMASIENSSFKAETLSKDGAWCWFSDPRAIYVHGMKPGVLTGWVKTDGSIETALLNTKNNTIQTEVIYAQLEEDDHDNPAFVECTPDNFLAFYAKHGGGPLYKNHASGCKDSLFKKVEPFNPISEDELKKYPRKTITYANPFVLKNENNRLYCFGRWTGFKPNMIWSDDAGKTFSNARVFITNTPFNSGNRPYVKYFSNGNSKVHIVFTDGHPRDEPTNSIYYAYYENGAFWKAGGEKICTIDELPFEPKDASLIYEATPETGRAWVYDVCSDENDQPFVLYARYPDEKTHLYQYARFKDQKWIKNEICNAGKWFPQTIQDKVEKEPHYSGGMTIDPRHPNTIYLSQNINGVFEIMKYKTSNDGETWETTAITKNSKRDNVRPYFPRNMQDGDTPVLLWMENEMYVHYTLYKSNIKYLKL